MRVEQATYLECEAVRRKILVPDKDNIQGSARIRNLQIYQDLFPVDVKGPLSMFLLREKLLRN